jgi:hypothetical protein
MKIKLLTLAAILVGTLGLAGCYDAYPGYGYGGGDPPAYAGGYYPAGGWGGWSGWGPGYYGGHGWDWNHGGWDHGYVVPEHGGFVAHNYGAPRGGRGYDVAHNEFRGGYRGSAGARGGGASHAAARGASHSGGGSHSDDRR